MSQWNKNLFFKPNAIYARLKNKVFPHTDVLDVTLADGLTASICLNDIFQKFLNNDIIIEKRLKTSQQVQVNLDENKKRELNDSVVNISSMTLYTDVYENLLGSHMKEYHGADNVINYINRYCMDTKLERLSYNNQRITNSSYSNDNILTSSSNDIVYRTFTEKDFPDAVKIEIKNSVTNGNYNKNPILFPSAELYNKKLPTLDVIPFTYREWFSGYRELYVYVPTTYTFYQEGRQETTWFKLIINRFQLDIDGIYNACVTGQSIPLLSYLINGMFNNVIRPSIWKIDSSQAFPIKLDNNRQYPCELEFACYGTDALAIKITGFNIREN